MKTVYKLFSATSTRWLAIFFGVFSLGQLQRFQLSNSSALYAHDVLIGAFLLWYCVRDNIIQKLFQNIPLIFKKIQKSFRLELAWVVWTLGSTAAGLIAGTVGERGILYLGRLVFYTAFIAAARAAAPKKFIRQALLFTGMLMALWGAVQYLWLPDTRFLSIFGWDNHYYRLVGTLFDPAFMGMMLVLTFGWWQFPKVLPAVPSAWRQAMQLLLAAAIAATFSRASYAALFVFILLELFGKKMRAAFAVTVGVVWIATLLLLPKPGGEGVNLARTSTSDARLVNAQQNLITLHGAQWLWGRGLFNNDARQTYATPSHAQLPDSLPVLLLNATGVGGTVLALFVLAKWLPVWLKKNPTWAHLLVAVLVHSVFNNTLLQPFIFLSLWLGL